MTVETTTEHCDYTFFPPNAFEALHSYWFYSKSGTAYLSLDTLFWETIQVGIGCT